MRFNSRFDIDEKRLEAALAAIQAAPGGMDGYLRAPLPDPTDQAISDAIERFIIQEASPYKRNQAVGAFARIYGYFSTFALRMAMEAVRKSSRDLLVKAVIGNAVEIRGIDDYRYGLITTSIMVRAAEQLGADTAQVFKEAGDLTNATNYLLAFLQRSETDQRMEAMGYYEGDSPAGIIFWPEPEQAPENWRRKD